MLVGVEGSSADLLDVEVISADLLDVVVISADLLLGDTAACKIQHIFD